MEKVLQQDSTQVAEPQTLLMVKLLFKNEVELCDQTAWSQALQNTLGKGTLAGDQNGYMMALEEYQATFTEKGKEVQVPVLYNMLGPMEFSIEEIKELERSQFWDVENAQEMLGECTKAIALFDMMSSSLDYQKRIEVAVLGVEAALHLYKDCIGVYAIASGKFMTRQQLLDNADKTMIFRFLSMYVNVRYFRIQNSEDQLVDSLGLYALGLPDVQVHYHDLNPDAVVNHVYNIASYQLEHEVPILDEQTIDGLGEDGFIDETIQWPCRYEDSLIQPIREVLDVCPNEFAAGNREN